MKRTLIVILILALVGLGGWGVERYIRSLRPTATTSSPATSKPAAVSAPTNSAAPAANGATAVVTDAPFDTTPQTYTVAEGDTLFTIGLKFDVLWSTIADLNGLTENSALQIGQTIKLPLTTSGYSIHIQTITNTKTDTVQAQTAQHFGDVTWHNDPLAVTEKTAPSDYHLTHADSYQALNLNKTAGTVTVRVTRPNQIIDFNLTQPETVGDDGVWFISSVTSYQK